MKYVLRFLVYNYIGFGVYGALSTLYILLAHNIPDFPEWAWNLWGIVITLWG